MFFHKLTHTNAHTQGAVENLECPVGGKKAENHPAGIILFFGIIFGPLFG